MCLICDEKLAARNTVISMRLSLLNGNTCRAVRGLLLLCNICPLLNVPILIVSALLYSSVLDGRSSANLPFVLGPLFAMDTTPRLLCFRFA